MVCLFSTCSQIQDYHVGLINRKTFALSLKRYALRFLAGRQILLRHLMPNGIHRTIQSYSGSGEHHDPRPLFQDLRCNSRYFVGGGGRRELSVDVDGEYMTTCYYDKLYFLFKTEN
jgi:hypothetical protein